VIEGEARRKRVLDKRRKSGLRAEPRNDSDLGGQSIDRFRPPIGIRASKARFRFDKTLAKLSTEVNQMSGSLAVRSRRRATTSSV
jgi:hypothetical protein